MPPEPTSSSSSYRSASTSPTINLESFPWFGRLTEGGGQRLLPRSERLVELRVGHAEGHEHADAVPVDTAGDEEQPAPQRRVDDRIRELRSRRPRCGVRDELDREHRPEAAHVADRIPALLPAEHARPDRLTELRRALDEPLFLDH